MSDRRALLVGALVGLAVGLGLLGILAGKSWSWPDGLETPRILYDTSAYADAFDRVLAGHSPYAPSTLAGPEDARAFGSYRYLPPFALLLAPIALLPRLALVLLVLLGGTALYGAATAAALSRLRLRAPLLALLVGVVCLNPLAVIGFGNGNIAMLTAPVYLVALAGPARSRLAGALLGATGLVRLETGLLLAILGLRDRRLLAAGAATGAALVGLSLLVPGGAAAWADAPTAFANVAAGLVPGVTGNASAAYALSSAGLPALPVSIALALLALGLGLVALRHLPFPAALLAASTLALLPLPTVWPQAIAVLFPLSLAVLVRSGIPVVALRRAVLLLMLVSSTAVIIDLPLLGYLVPVAAVAYGSRRR